MVFTTWQIGMDIQHESIRVVAVQRQRQGWQLRHWWQLPLPEGTFSDGLIMNTEALTKALVEWRKELPLRHQIRISFPGHGHYNARFRHPINVCLNPQEKLISPQQLPVSCR